MGFSQRFDLACCNSEGRSFVVTRRGLAHATFPKGHGLSLGSTDTYNRNLTALQSRQARTAERIHTSPLPYHSQRNTARDGTESATYLDEKGRRVWLGRSSMPRVSTEAQLDGSVFEPGNVSTPGILTGLEPISLLQRLSPQFAVFVIERRLKLVKLAMHIHDYTAAFQSGRLVIVPEDQLDETFETFFTQHPGYEIPPHLLTAVQRTPHEIAELRAKLESVAARISAIQHDAAIVIARTIRPTSNEELRAKPRLALLSVDTNPETWALAERITSAAVCLGWTTTCCVPDSPEKCHLLARLQAVADVGANFILFLGGGSGVLRPRLPESLPIASWFLPTSPIHEDLTPALGTYDSVGAASQHVRKQLESILVPADRIEDLPVGVTVLPAPESHEPRAPRSDKPIHVLVLADLPTTDPEACGIGLPSHVALWNTLLRQAMDDAAARHPLDVDGLFERAQRNCGTTLDDSGLISRLRHSAATRILPTAETTTFVKTVASVDSQVSLYGQNLSALAAGRCHFCGAIPTFEKLTNVLHDADILMIPTPDVRAMSWSLHALAMEVAVLCRSSAIFHRECSDMIANPLASIHWFEKADEITTCLMGFISDGAASWTASRHASQNVGKNHNLESRLRYLHSQAVTTTQEAPIRTALT